MFRQLAVRGFRGIIIENAKCPESLGAASLRELSLLACQVMEPAASLDSCREIRSLPESASTLTQRVQRLQARAAPRLEIWRHCATAAAAPRPAVFLANLASQKATTEAAKTKTSRTASATTAKSSTVARAKTSGSSRASSTARGRAAAERRRAVYVDQIKQARAKAKAQAAESIAKAKAREKAIAEKLKTEIKVRVADVRARAEKAKAEAIAKVKAEAKQKLEAALEKANAKASQLAARLEAQSKAVRIKRAPTALNFYVSDQMKANTKLTLKEAVQRFRDLPAEDKQKYEDQATAAKAEVHRERQKLASARSARSVTSSYMFFTSEQRPVVLAANPGISFMDVAKRLGEMWRGLNVEQRQKYVDLSIADRKAKGLKALSSLPVGVAAKATISKLGELSAEQ